MTRKFLFFDWIFLQRKMNAFRGIQLGIQGGLYLSAAIVFLPF